MSRWFFFTVGATIVSVVLSSVVVYWYLKHSVALERKNDEIYLKRQSKLLRHAVNVKLNDDTKTVQIAAGKLLSNNRSASTVTDDANDKLKNQVLDQHKTLRWLKTMYKGIIIKKIEKSGLELL